MQKQFKKYFVNSKNIKLECWLLLNIWEKLKQFNQIIKNTINKIKKTLLVCFWNWKYENIKWHDKYNLKRLKFAIKCFMLKPKICCLMHLLLISGQDLKFSIRFVHQLLLLLHKRKIHWCISESPTGLHYTKR